MNTYGSIVPSEMTNSELQHMQTELFTAINWGLSHATVKLKNGLQYRVPVVNIDDYRKPFKTVTG